MIATRRAESRELGVCELSRWLWARDPVIDGDFILSDELIYSRLGGGGRAGYRGADEGGAFWDYARGFPRGAG